MFGRKRKNKAKSRHEQGFGAADFGPVTIDGLDADVADAPGAQDEHGQVFGEGYLYTYASVEEVKSNAKGKGKGKGADQKYIERQRLLLQRHSGIGGQSRQGVDGRPSSSVGSLDRSLEGFGFEGNTAEDPVADAIVELYLGDEGELPECGWHSANGICTTPGGRVGGHCPRHTCSTSGCGKGKSSADPKCTSCLHPEFGADLDDTDSDADADVDGAAAPNSTNPNTNNNVSGGADEGEGGKDGVVRRGVNRRGDRRRPASILQSGVLPDLADLRSAVESMIVEGGSVNAGATAAGSSSSAFAVDNDNDNDNGNGNDNAGSGSGSWGFGGGGDGSGFDTGPTSPTSPSRRTDGSGANTFDFDRRSAFFAAGQAELLAATTGAAALPGMDGECILVDQLNDPNSLYNTLAGTEAAESAGIFQESAYAELPGNGDSNANGSAAQDADAGAAPAGADAADQSATMPTRSMSRDSQTSMAVPYIVSMVGGNAIAAAIEQFPETIGSSNEGTATATATAWGDYGAGVAAPDQQELDLDVDLDLDHHFGADDGNNRDSVVSEEAVPYRVMIPRRGLQGPAATAAAAAMLGTAYLAPGQSAPRAAPAPVAAVAAAVDTSPTNEGRRTLGDKLDSRSLGGGHSATAAVADAAGTGRHARPSLADELNVIAGFGEYAVGGMAGVAGTRNSLYSRVPNDDDTGGDGTGGAGHGIDTDSSSSSSNIAGAPSGSVSVGVLSRVPSLSKHSVVAAAKHTAAVATAWGATLDRNSDSGAGSAEPENGGVDDGGGRNNRESGVDLDALMVDQANDPDSLYNGGRGGGGTLRRAAPPTLSDLPISTLDPDFIYATALDSDDESGSAARQQPTTELKFVELDSLIGSTHLPADSSEVSPTPPPPTPPPPASSAVASNLDSNTGGGDGVPGEIVSALRDELSIMRNQLRSELGLQSEVEALRSELHQLRHGLPAGKSTTGTFVRPPTISTGRRPMLHPEQTEDADIITALNRDGGVDDDEDGNDFYYSEISADAMTVFDGEDGGNGGGGGGGGSGGGEGRGSRDCSADGGNVNEIDTDDDIYGPDPNKLTQKKANKRPPPPLPAGGTSSRRPGSIWRGIGDDGPSPDNSTIELVAKMYGKRRDAILGGKHLVTEPEAVLLGALQIQIEYGEHVKPGTFNMRSVLPIEYADEPTAIKEVFEQQQQDWTGTTDAEARKEYIRVCRRSATYGAINFLVKERIKGRGKAVHKILGVAKDALLGIDVTTREVVNRYSLKSIRRWQAQGGTFTVELGDGGDLERTELRFQTDQGQAISRLIAVVIAGYDKRAQQATLQRDGSRQNPLVPLEAGGGGGKNSSAFRAAAAKSRKRNSPRAKSMSENTLARQIAEALSGTPRKTRPGDGSSMTLPRKTQSGGESPEPIRRSSQTLPRSLGGGGSGGNVNTGSADGSNAGSAGPKGNGVSFDALKAQMDMLRKRAATNQRAFEGDFDNAPEQKADADAAGGHDGGGGGSAAPGAAASMEAGAATFSGGGSGGIGAGEGMGYALPDASNSIGRRSPSSHTGILAQSGSWLYTQLHGKIKTGRKIARAAIKAMKNIDDVQLRSDPAWRRATQASSAKHVKRHCTIIQDALEALVELTMVITEVGTASADVDFGTAATWVATISQHIAPLARNVKVCAAFVFDLEDMQSTWDGPAGRLLGTACRLGVGIDATLGALKKLIRPASGTGALAVPNVQSVVDGAQSSETCATELLSLLTADASTGQSKVSTLERRARVGDGANRGNPAGVRGSASARPQHGVAAVAAGGVQYASPETLPHTRDVSNIGGSGRSEFSVHDPSTTRQERLRWLTSADDSQCQSRASGGAQGGTYAAGTPPATLQRDATQTSAAAAAAAALVPVAEPDYAHGGVRDKKYEYRAEKAAARARSAAVAAGTAPARPDLSYADGGGNSNLSGSTLQRGYITPQSQFTESMEGTYASSSTMLRAGFDVHDPTTSREERLGWLVSPASGGAHSGAGTGDGKVAAADRRENTGGSSLQPPAIQPRPASLVFDDNWRGVDAGPAEHLYANLGVSGERFSFSAEQLLPPLAILDLDMLVPPITASAATNFTSASSAPASAAGPRGGGAKGAGGGNGSGVEACHSMSHSVRNSGSGVEAAGGVGGGVAARPLLDSSDVEDTSDSSNDGSGGGDDDAVYNGFPTETSAAEGVIKSAGKGTLQRRRFFETPAQRAKHGRTRVKAADDSAWGTYGVPASVLGCTKTPTPAEGSGNAGDVDVGAKTPRQEMLQRKQFSALPRDRARVTAAAAVRAPSPPTAPPQLLGGIGQAPGMRGVTGAWQQGILSSDEDEPTPEVILSSDEGEPNPEGGGNLTSLSL